MIRWLFLDLDSYFASCEQQVRPELRGKPVGIVPVVADTSCCIAASREAKKRGVKTGTGIAEARLRCPEITFLISRPDLYTLYHKTIVELVSGILPIDAILSIDEMICELSGSQRELPNALALAQKIKRALKQQVGDVLTCSIGLATNRFLAKVGSDMNKPNGITVIQKEDLPTILLPLKPEDLPGIGPRMAIRLQTRGISTMESLYSLSAQTMTSIWGGIVGKRFYNWMRGEDVRLPPTVHRTIGHQHVLEPEFRTSEGSWRVTKKLLTKAMVRLRKDGYFARRLHVYISFTGDLYWEAEMKLEETQDTIFAISALRKIWQKRPEGIPFMVSVNLRDLVPAHSHQLSLLVNPTRENLGPAMDKINAKFGKGTLSVGMPEPAQYGSPTRIPFTRVPDLEEF
jgi:DNA polymerase IV